MILSSPTKAPPQMNRMFVVSICRNSCCGCLRPPFGRHAGHRALDDLEQRLLHALAGDVAGDRRVLALARDLVDLVDVDDAALGALDVVVRRLEQVEDDVLDVLADVAGLGQRGGVGDRERHVEDLGQRLRQQRLAASRWARAAGCSPSAARRRPRRTGSRCGGSGCAPRPTSIFLARSCPITYSSRVSLISCGFGHPRGLAARPPPARTPRR